MSWRAPPRRFDPAVPEIMDRRGNDPALLRADLRVLANINRQLGGHQIPLQYLRRWQKPVLTILDLATGAADVPRAIVQWARRQRIKVEITAVDGNEEILAIAREWSAGYPEIEFAHHNLLALPYGAGSYDIVLNSLTLHHFAETDVVTILRRIHEIARTGYVINDLRRHWLAIWGSKLMARTIIQNPIAQYDAPASCERAFTIGELRDLAIRAGLPVFEMERHWGYRMALIGHPGASSSVHRSQS